MAQCLLHSYLKVINYSHFTYLLLFHVVSSSGAVIYSEVRAFLKKQSSIVTQYRSITTVDGTLTLTGNHLLYVQKSLEQTFNPM